MDPTPQFLEILTQLQIARAVGELAWVPWLAGAAVLSLLVAAISAWTEWRAQNGDGIGYGVALGIVCLSLLFAALAMGNYSDATVRLANPGAYAWQTWIGGLKLMVP